MQLQDSEETSSCSNNDMQRGLRGTRHLHSQGLQVTRHEHHHHHVYIHQPTEDSAAADRGSAIQATLSDGKSAITSDATCETFDVSRGSGSRGRDDDIHPCVHPVLDKEGSCADQHGSVRAPAMAPCTVENIHAPAPGLRQQCSVGRARQTVPGAMYAKVGNTSGALSRAGATAIMRNSSSAPSDGKAFAGDQRLLAEASQGDVLNNTADMWHKYQRSKSATRTRMDRHPRWSTLADDAQDRRVDERLNNLDAQNQWLQKRSFVQRQFRELHDSGVKRRLVGDPRLRETFDTHFIAKLKQGDIQRDRDRARKIKGVMQDVAQSRHQLIQMQQQFRELIGEEPPPRPEDDILQQFRANLISSVNA